MGRLGMPIPSRVSAFAYARLPEADFSNPARCLALQRTAARALFLNLKITTGQTHYLDWTSTRIATATIATAMNIQYWIRTPKMSKPSTRTCMAIAPFAGRDFHSMFIASKPFHSHLPTTFAAKLRWLSRCAFFTFSMANTLRRSLLPEDPPLSLSETQSG